MLIRISWEEREQLENNLNILEASIHGACAMLHEHKGYDRTSQGVYLAHQLLSDQLTEILARPIIVEDVKVG